MAYDALCESMTSRASQQYVQILQLAARESETAVDDALRVLLAEERPVTFEAVAAEVHRGQPTPVTDVIVEMTDLACFDDLLTNSLFTDQFTNKFNKEVCDGESHGAEDGARGLVAGIALAGVPDALRGVGEASATRDAVV
jgi:hypothetical protein